MNPGHNPAQCVETAHDHMGTTRSKRYEKAYVVDAAFAPMNQQSPGASAHASVATRIDDIGRMSRDSLQRACTSLYMTSSTCRPRRQMQVLAPTRLLPSPTLVSCCLLDSIPCLALVQSHSPAGPGHRWPHSQHPSRMSIPR